MSLPDSNPESEPVPHWDLTAIVQDLKAAREQWRHRRHRDRDKGDREFPSPDRVRDLLGLLRGALFPLRLGPTDLQRGGEDFYVGHALDRALTGLVEEARLELASHATADEARRLAQARISAFAHSLPELRALLDTDVEAAFQGDPAARSVDEVLLCYPGVHALIHHRLAHRLYQLGLPLIARIIAELAHSETGIDIHPGARIGRYCFIDHGTGVVIGETAEIGNHVRLYQAVTLGAKRFEVGEDGSLAKGQPRHPVVEDDVVIYAGATVLGRIVIGRGSSIGGNVWLTRSVPPNSQITQAQSQHANRGPNDGHSA
ncbi:serine O-acetyltransferase EpsC [Hydrocarboniphaga effusa]|uniref:serine O-acetyltransferase EpsC n=1 Tax=Hydrocarboniphaga effusa TaxID=243629 RepID=UPI00398C0AE4